MEEIERLQLAEMARTMDTYHLRTTRRIWLRYAEFVDIIEAELERRGLDLAAVAVEDLAFREDQLKRALAGK